MRTRYTIILCLIVGAGLGCGDPKDPIPVSEVIIAAPHQRLNDAAMFFYEHSVLRWRLDTEYMERPLADTGNILVSPVRINVYDSLGNLSTNIVSDSGKSDPDMNVFDLWGRVRIENQDGMIVKSEQLQWLKNARRVTSETFVQIETAKGDILRGKGLDAMDDFSRFSFSSQVSGIFPDFRQRMEDGDEEFFM